MTVKELAQHIRRIDCCMMTTLDADGNFRSRPMLTILKEDDLNNLHFFCMKDSQKIRDLMANAAISLTYQEPGSGLYIQVYGKAELTGEPAQMRPYWDKKLNVWWPREADTEGISMISVKTQWVRYWFEGKNEVIRFA
ncbi:MAG: pyridoxamine 5'-phosphate oxidase family protein [Petrimonas sp.]|nr:pyridoxamine 5'-phosphate oxidase family protein [Petrimonas sp.]